MVVDLFGIFVEADIFTMKIREHSFWGINFAYERVEVFLFDVVVLFVSDVYPWDYSEDLWDFQNIDVVVLLLDLK